MPGPTIDYISMDSTNTRRRRTTTGRRSGRSAYAGGKYDISPSQITALNWVLRICIIVFVLGSITLAAVILGYAIDRKNKSNEPSTCEDVTLGNNTLSASATSADCECDDISPFCPEGECAVQCGGLPNELPLPFTNPPDPMPGCLDMTGRVVVVIGASRGIGLMVMQEFASQGAVVFGCARSATVNDNMLELPTGPYSWTYSQCDVTQEASMTSFLGTATAHNGQVDMVVYTAGVYAIGRGFARADAPLRKVMSTNFAGLTRVFRLFRPVMNQPDTRFVTVSSIESLIPNPSTAVYSGSQAARDWQSRAAAGAYTFEEIDNGRPGVDEPHFLNIYAGITRTVMGNTYRGSDIADFDPSLLDFHVNVTKVLHSLASDTLTLRATDVARQIFLAACDPLPLQTYSALGSETAYPGLHNTYNELIAVFTATPPKDQVAVYELLWAGVEAAYNEVIDATIAEFGAAAVPILLECSVCSHSDLGPACTVGIKGFCQTLGCTAERCPFGPGPPTTSKRTPSPMMAALQRVSERVGYMGMKTQQAGWDKLVANTKAQYRAPRIDML